MVRSKYLRAFPQFKINMELLGDHFNFYKPVKKSPLCRVSNKLLRAPYLSNFVYIAS